MYRGFIRSTEVRIGLWIYNTAQLAAFSSSMLPPGLT